MALDLFTSHVRHDIEDLREVVDLTERYLKGEVKRLERRVTKELKEISGEEEREFTIGWYADDFVRLDRVYPHIQRRALFTTLMCMTEADLILGCRMCRRAFEIPQEFKKKGNERVIVQALAYLQKHLTIRDRSLKRPWELVQNLWSVRNALVHNDGKPKPLDLQSISDFCAPIPTLELDHHNRIILKEGSVQMALHAVNQFFTCLIDEIKRNKLPNQCVQATK
ncbi:MAG: hypothetical protein MUO63_09195 [Desulfobulbaceae bacterium]|nr:hypothetical protein [Desulfobulbaceae bacterium]